MSVRRIAFVLVTLVISAGSARAQQYEVSQIQQALTDYSPRSAWTKGPLEARALESARAEYANVDVAVRRAQEFYKQIPADRRGKPEVVAAKQKLDELATYRDALREAIRQTELASGVGPAVAAAADASAGAPALIADQIKRDHSSADVLRLFALSNTAFEARWKEYGERHQAVAAALEQAKALEAKGDLDGAWTALAAMLTAAPACESRCARQSIELRDAELDVIAKLAELAPKTGHARELLTLPDAYTSRRQVADDKELERFVWLVHRNSRALEHFSLAPGDPLRDAIEAAQQRLAKDLRDKGALASKWLVTPAYAWEGKTKRPGANTWVVIQLDDLMPIVKVAGDRVSLDTKRGHIEQYACHETGKVDHIDSNGTLVYRLACKEHTVMERARLTATLASKQPAPEHATALVGQVVSAGPPWKLAKAELVDTKALAEARASGEWVPDVYEAFASGGLSIERNKNR